MAGINHLVLPDSSNATITLPFGSCSTAAGTAAKTVACTGYTLSTGSMVAVKFTVTNSASSPTLNVNSTGAKAIQYRGAAITAGYLAANRTYVFVYTGTNYELIGDIDTNTTYSAGTAAELTAGTATGTRVWSPKIIADYVTGAVSSAVGSAMQFKGNVDSNSDLPTSGVKVGDTYRVNTAGTYAGMKCEVGDLLIATSTTPTWTSVQNNLDPKFTGTQGTTGETSAGTPAGTVSKPTFTGTAVRLVSSAFNLPATTHTVAAGTASDNSWQDAGTIELTSSTATPTFSVAAGTSSDNTWQDAGTIGFTTGNKTPTFSVAAGTSSDNTWQDAGTIEFTNTNRTPTISVAAGTSSDNTWQDGGTVSQPTFTGTALASHNHSFTPAGTIAVNTAGATKTITLTVDDTNHNLTIGGTVWSSNTATIKTGDAAYKFTGTAGTTGDKSAGTPAGTVSKPTFTGSYHKATMGSVPVPSSAAFTGSYHKATIGSVSVPTSATFTGAYHKATLGSVATVTGATFTGAYHKLSNHGTTSTTLTVSKASSGTTTFTPEGTVSQPTFTGTALAAHTHTFTPAGTIS